MAESMAEPRRHWNIKAMPRAGPVPLLAETDFEFLDSPRENEDQQQ